MDGVLVVTGASRGIGTFLPSREAVRRMSTRRGGKGGVILDVAGGR